MGFDYTVYTRQGKHSWRVQRKPCEHQDPGERSTDPTRDRPRLACERPGVSSRGVGRWWPDAGSVALNTTVHAQDKAEEPEIKLPISAGSWKKQDLQKASISALLTMPKLLTVWITINCGKFFRRSEYQTT